LIEWLRVMGEDRGIVFIVDDDAPMRRALARLTEGAGFRTRGFTSGAEFLAADHGSRPACVVLDLRLPDMHGLEVQRRLARSNPELGVVIVTGYGDDLTRREALEAGAVAFLSKPFDDQMLLDAIREAMAGPKKGASV
jgi:FixJ family two-component response regulator